MLKNLDFHSIIKNYKKENFFIIIFWTSLWLAIGAHFNDIKNFNKNTIDILNFFRILLPLFLVILSTIIIFYLIKKKSKIKIITDNLINLFLFYFIFQIIGLYYNTDAIFSFHNLYLVFLGIGVINIFIIMNLMKIEKTSEVLLYLSIILIIIFSIIILVSVRQEILNLLVNKNYLYNLIDTSRGPIFLNQQYPRITGVSRMLAIINIFLIIYLNYNNRFKSVIIFILITIISSVIWGMQSRGTLVCFFASILVIVFFYKKFSFIHKSILFLSLTILPIVTFAGISNALYEKNKLNLYEKNKLNNEIVKEPNVNEIMKDKNRKADLRIGKITTSGRIDLWLLAIKSYEKKKFFGYGPQGDRYLLIKENFKDKGNELNQHFKDTIVEFSTNISSSILYAFLCGGYLGIVVFIFIYYRTIFLLYDFFFKKFFLKKIKISVKISIIFLIFFLIRSLIENSFALFSVDFMLFFVSFFIVENFVKKQNKKVPRYLS
jgi:hypothetical protein